MTPPSMFVQPGSLLHAHRSVVYLLLALTTLVLLVNAHDSGLAKTPAFVLCATLILACAIALWLFTGRIEIRYTALDAGVSFFLLVCTVSGLRSAYPYHSLPAVGFTVCAGICYFSGKHLFERKESMVQLSNVVALISGVVCVVGLVQFFLGDRMALDFFIGKDRRIGSTLGNPVFLSGYIVLVAPLFIVRTLDKDLTRVSRALHAVLVLALVFLLMVTQSRSSMIAFSIASILLLALFRRADRRILLGIMLAAAIVSGVALLVSPHLVHRLGSAFSFDPTSSFARRLYFWESGIEAFNASPWVGHGFGSYEVIMRSFRSPDYWIVKSEDVVPHAHNELIEIASDMGVVGLLAFIVMIVMLAMAGTRALRSVEPWKRVYGAAFVSSLLGIFIDNLANVSQWQAPVAALTWLFMGILAARPFSSSVLFAKTISLPSPRALALVPLAGWVVFAWFYGGTLRATMRADAHVIRGVMANVNGHSEQAVAEFREAIASDPENLFARSSLSLVLLKTNRFTELVDVTSAIKEISPTYPKANLMQAIAFFSLSRYPEALASIQREIQLRSHPEAFYVQALVYQALADSKGERASLEGLLESCIRGGTTYQVETTTGRLLVLAESREELQHLKEILREFLAAVPGNESATRAQELIEKRLHVGNTTLNGRSDSSPPTPH